MFSDPIQLVLGLFVVAVALAFIARRIGVAYPILLVIGGLVLGFVPNVPPIVLVSRPRLPSAPPADPVRCRLLDADPRLQGERPPDRVARCRSRAVHNGRGRVRDQGVDPRDAGRRRIRPRRHRRSTRCSRRNGDLPPSGVPRRIVTILEGESLVNDATALIAYKFAVAAAVTGLFSPAEAGVSFVWVALGGVAVGVIVGIVLTEAWRRTTDPTLEIMLSLLAPFAAYLPAQAIGVSGVLATVVAGLIAGRRAARALSPDARLLGRGVWDIVDFMINGFAFMLIGLQLPAILSNLAPRTAPQLIGMGVAISLTVIVVRILWVFPATYLPRRLSARIRARDPYPTPAAVLVVSWAGMRGAVSLAAALALPLLPKPFPERDLVIFLTFCVIVATLVGQGLTLPWLVHRLHIVSSGREEGEEAQARRAAVDAALVRLTDLEGAYPDHRPLIDQLRSRYEHEAGHAVPTDGDPQDESEQELLDHREIRNAVLFSEREAIIRLRDDGVISDDVLRRVERDLDLEAVRSGA